jgi:hypothetical protein
MILNDDSLAGILAEVRETFDSGAHDDVIVREYCDRLEAAFEEAVVEQVERRLSSAQK